jgi:molybdate transport system substrate-binding protein
MVAVSLVTAAIPSAAKRAPSGSLTVFAAASLKDACEEAATAFQAANADREVEFTFNFAASSTLARQLVEGAPADVFASADEQQMATVVRAEGIAGVPALFARNRLVIITPADNPAKIASLQGLARSGVALVTALPSVPVRRYTEATLAKAGTAYGVDFVAAVKANIASEEENVRAVSLKVSLGEADAGIVYQSDVTPAIADKLMVIAIPDEFNVIATYPIGVIKGSAHLDLAEAFVAFVQSEAGQAILVKWNFLPAVDLQAAATPAAAEPTAQATSEATPTR